MASITNDDSLHAVVQDMQQKVQTLLARAPLTARQHEDLTMIQQGITQFLAQIDRDNALIFEQADTEAKRQVRHSLRNHINLVIGFSGVLIKELPDNLLRHMVAIRQINQQARELLAFVNAI